MGALCEWTTFALWRLYLVREGGRGRCRPGADVGGGRVYVVREGGKEGGSMDAVSKVDKEEEEQEEEQKE